MKVKVIRTIFVVLILSFFGIARADIVELDLFSIGCPTEFDHDSPYWQTDFDMGTSFIEISHVYMDWSGEITAGLATDPTKPGPQPFPLDVGIYASLTYPRITDVWGGEATYPKPESFDCLSEIQAMSWSDLLDGKGIISLGYEELVGPYLTYVEHGSISLDRVILRVDGVIVPEPTTLLFLMIGMISIRVKRLGK